MEVYSILEEGQVEPNPSSKDSNPSSDDLVEVDTISIAVTKHTRRTKDVNPTMKVINNQFKIRLSVITGSQ